MGIRNKKIFDCSVVAFWQLPEMLFRNLLLSVTYKITSCLAVVCQIWGTLSFRLLVRCNKNLCLTEEVLKNSTLNILLGGRKKKISFLGFYLGIRLIQLICPLTCPTAVVCWSWQVGYDNILFINLLLAFDYIYERGWHILSRRFRILVI